MFVSCWRSGWTRLQFPVLSEFLLTIVALTCSCGTGLQCLEGAEVLV